MKTIQPGDAVAYSVQFLRSIGAMTGEMPQARGTVTELTKLGSMTLARIDWGGFEMPERVNVANLAKVGLNTRFSTC